MKSERSATDLVPSEEAAKLIKKGKAPAGMRVDGILSFKPGEIPLLPEGLEAPQLSLKECSRLTALPRGMRVTRLILDGCTGLEELPEDLECYFLSLAHSGVVRIPSSLRVEYKLDLQGCTKLEFLPPGLRVSSLDLRNCTALERLPEGLAVHFLDLDGCTILKEWPRQASVTCGRLNARGLTFFTTLPEWVKGIAQLDVGGCARLAMIPEDLQVTGWIELAGTAISKVPRGSRGVELRWRGVPLPEHAAFRPETVTAREILEESNAERRRVLLERCGYERFMTESNAEIRDQDTDTGGERKLFRVVLEGDEDLLCVSVNCPSTDRRYMIRVPPDTKTCRQAVAWIAGYDDPDDYKPLIET